MTHIYTGVKTRELTSILSCVNLVIAVLYAIAKAKP